MSTPRLTVRPTWGPGWVLAQSLWLSLPMVVLAVVMMLIARQIWTTAGLPGLAFLPAAVGFWLLLGAGFELGNLIAITRSQEPILEISAEGLRDLRVCPERIDWKDIIWRRYTEHSRNMTIPVIEIMMTRPYPVVGLVRWGAMTLGALPFGWEPGHKCRIREIEGTSIDEIAEVMSAFRKPSGPV